MEITNNDVELDVRIKRLSPYKSSPGEFVAVMNGVEFRTRHNDYKFKKAINVQSLKFTFFFLFQRLR